MITKQLNESNVIIQAELPQDNINLLPGIGSYSNIAIKTNKSIYEGDFISSEFDSSVDKADALDYEFAIISGIFSGVIDSFFVGEFSLDEANEWGDETVKKFVISISSKLAGEDLSIDGAIKYLEKEYKIPSDNLKNYFGGSKWHHINDFSHHFSVIGLVFSILTQFTKHSYGLNGKGEWVSQKVEDLSLIGNGIYEKLGLGIITWFFHMVSDMAGSNKTAGNGMGIPGPIISFIKTCSAVPFFKHIKTGKGKDDELWRLANRLYAGTTFADRDEKNGLSKVRKIDFRTEVGISKQLTKQMIPVIINTCTIRAFYLLRKAITEIQECNVRKIADLDKIDWGMALSFDTVEFARINTVANAAFMFVDTADAAVRSAIINGWAVSPKFAVDILLRINIVGIGSFVYAAGNDIRKTREVAKRNKDKFKKELHNFEKTLVAFEYIAMDKEQSNIMRSIQKEMVLYDIKKESKIKTKEYKRIWLEKWESLIRESDPDLNLLSIDKVYKLFDDENYQKKLSIVLVNAIFFDPYHSLNDELDAKFKSLKVTSDYYLSDLFLLNQYFITAKDIKRMRKSYERIVSFANGSSTRKFRSIVGTTTATAAAGVAAFMFAPAMAPIIAGTLMSSSVAGLSGAALTSASLAAIGGGSLATGGLGMAGGTMIISGSGAALTFAGSTGVSSMINYGSEDTSALIIDKTVKTVLFCKEFLNRKFNDKETIKAFISTFENQVELFRNMEIKIKEEIKTSDNKKSLKEQLKIVQKNHKAIENGLQYLRKIR